MGTTEPKRVLFVWENFGPIHADRCEALAQSLGDDWEVVGIERAGFSNTYEWKSEGGKSFRKVTLFPNTTIDQVAPLRELIALLKVCVALRAEAYFLCQYEQPATLALAVALRLMGRRVFVMNDSKFDDRERSFWWECLKRVFYFPYNGGLASSPRAKDYMRFLGVPKHRIALNYYAMSTERIRRLAGSLPAPDGIPFADRFFTIVARFVTKKNLAMALEAYAIYKAKTDRPRPLHLVGSGPLESILRQRVAELDLASNVVFRGFLQTDDVCQTLGHTLALILPSVEEQFGNVVIEAQALNVPVIVSENCGARDTLVRSGVNGFVVEPDNPEGLAFFMGLLDSDEALWRRMCRAASDFSSYGDVAAFVDSVRGLIGRSAPDKNEGRAP